MTETIPLEASGEYLHSGHVGVIPTDTIYGVVASAHSPEAVERLYTLRDRDPSKPFIVLVASAEQLSELEVSASGVLVRVLEKLWPGPLSVILPCKGTTFEYLHRGTGSIAVRLPEDEALRQLIEETGPLVAPSANTAGSEPATTVAAARAYFGNRVDFYVDGGERVGEPSTLIALNEQGGVEVVREGVVPTSMIIAASQGG
jgi:L-threonylcarbamoyladenylate synthase